MKSKENSLQGKVVVITGASRGIGMETAFLFAKEKCQLALTYYTASNEIKEVVKKCRELGAEDVIAFELNVTKDASIKNAVKKIIDKYGRIDILDNNSGVIIWKNLKDTNYQEIEMQIRTNLEGLIKMTKECLPYVKDCIINISSGAGKQGYGTLATYCASKFGVRGFTQALAEEHSNLKIYSVNPGVTATRMNEFRGLHPAKVGGIIVNAAKGKYNVESGGDLDVWELVNE